MNASLVRRVLVPLDGSPHAELILPVLRRFLVPGESSITLLQALPYFDDSGGEETGHYLRRWARRLDDEGYPTTVALRRGSAADVIREVAVDQRASLIALATHGRTGMGHWALGSVAEEVLQSTPLPVLLVRPFASAAAMTPPHHLLMPMDEDLHDLEVLEPAIALAQGRDVRVRLLEVSPPTAAPEHWQHPGPATRKADQRLREACIPTTFERRHGHTAEEILRSAAEHHADLIAMTTHGRSGPSRVLLGSVTAEVLRRTTVPLLAVRRGAGKAAEPVEIPATPGAAAPGAPGAGAGTTLAPTKP